MTQKATGRLTAHVDRKVEKAHAGVVDELIARNPQSNQALKDHSAEPNNLMNTNG